MTEKKPLHKNPEWEAFWAKEPTEQEIFKTLEESGWDFLSAAPSELLADRKFMLKAVDTCGFALKYASDELKNDKEMVLFAIKSSSATYQRDPYIVLRYASEEMKANKDVVLAAVMINGQSLQYASEALREDKDIILAAAINNLWSLTYASPVLREDKAFVIELVKKVGKSALKFFGKTMQSDADILEAAKQYKPAAGRQRL